MIPETRIDIDGDTYVLSFDMWAFKELKRETGKDMLAGENMEGVDDVVALFWAALLRNHPDITIEKTAHLIHPGNLQELVDKLTELTGQAFSEPEGDEVKN